jgi:hypothetical protein
MEKQSIVLKDRVKGAFMRRNIGNIVAFEHYPASTRADDPPTSRRIVVLPEPDGPRMVRNSRSATSSSVGCRTVMAPYFLLTSLNVTLISGDFKATQDVPINFNPKAGFGR